MSVKRFYELRSTRSAARYKSSKIVCKSEELRKLIAKWTERAGWEFENFADFIELMGLKTPVKLIPRKGRTFKCITADEKEVEIILASGKKSNYHCEIWVIDDEETKKYRINYKPKGKRNIVPEVECCLKEIERDGKQLISYYCNFFCHRTLKLDNTYSLKIDIDEPNKFEEKSEIAVLRNCEEIENFLLSLKNPIVMTEVFSKVIRMLQFSNEDIRNSEEILIEYVQRVDDKEIVIKKKHYKNGKEQI